MLHKGGSEASDPPNSTVTPFSSMVSLEEERPSLAIGDCGGDPSGERDFASHGFVGITSLALKEAQIFKGLLASTLIARPFAIYVKHWTTATQHAYVVSEDLTNFWRRIESKLVPCAMSCKVTT